MEFLTKLYSYQRQAVEKLKKLKIGALYMEQGTGKTRTALEIINERFIKNKVNAVLWLCPCSVKKNLREDLLYHCGEIPENFIIKGIESLSKSDRLYLQLIELVTKYKCQIIVDESNLVKNPDAMRTGRITEIASHCTYKMILNGTPVSRNEADLFAQWYILDWRILGYKSYYSFAANHLEYKEVLSPNGHIIKTNRIENVLNIGYLTEKIAPYSFQIKKSKCLSLPKKNYREVYAYMTDEQCDIYADVKWRYLENVVEWRSETIYKLLSALQLVTSGRRILTDPTERMKSVAMFRWNENPRILKLRDLIKSDIKDEKCIIFCKYQSEIDDISAMLNNCGLTYIEFTGRISQKKRQVNRAAFKHEVQIMLANKQCGAYGLNLQFCHNVIFYSNDFDLATRMQAEDRVHRIGQTERVFIYDICTYGTVDSFITRCLLRKESMVNAFKNELAQNNLTSLGGYKMTDKTVQDARRQAEEIRLQFKQGLIDYKAAAAQLKPIKKIFDIRMAEKAEKYHVKPQKFSISMYLKMLGIPLAHEDKQHKPGVINVGYSYAQKKAAVEEYVKKNNIKHVIIFYPDKWATIEYDEAECVPYSEIIMYRTFNPLVEKINSDYLLVFDECMRLKKRNDLTYNCAHHYCKQTPHKLVFEFWPIIDKPDDFMILMDFIDADRYKGKHYSDDLLNEQAISVIEHPVSIIREDVSPQPTEKELAEYDAYKDKLFANLGKKDPNTIPRNLHLYAGTHRKKPLEGIYYIARNARYKSDWVDTYPNYQKGRQYTILDFPIRQLIFNDFLKKSGLYNLKFMHSGFTVDDVYFDKYTNWTKEVVNFYAQSNLHKQRCTNSGSGESREGI